MVLKPQGLVLLVADEVSGSTSGGVHIAVDMSSVLSSHLLVGYQQISVTMGSFLAHCGQGTDLKMILAHGGCPFQS